MTSFVIRDARADDADAVARVHVRSWQTAYRGLIDQEVLDGLSVSERAEGWRRIFADPLPTSLGTLVAVRDGAVIAWASFGSGRDPDGLDDAELYGIYADPDTWSTGAGHALLEAAEARMIEAGHTRGYLWVLDGNDRADGFYARHGWELDGATKIDQRQQFTLREHRRVKLLGPR
ncbi:GNAT family N-acetyltransferase [Microbacterium sufflavum]|uniref:GNAT family N-acetyltransferase n=1 Tax=Microbacterium sufflavum TaxID=2851649 RepID=A0ABY4ICL2_9MICO|nr:GNAT family N-acetyltransferase [Microbacterium sufflavum]UPL10045.1 GNAT family N-acetyltransferase [Microbacterium sufflavum]